MNITCPYLSKEKVNPERFFCIEYTCIYRGIYAKQNLVEKVNLDRFFALNLDAYIYIHMQNKILKRRARYALDLI